MEYTRSQGSNNFNIHANHNNGGENYLSEQDKALAKMEEQMILRVPPKLAERIRKMLRQKDSQNLNDSREFPPTEDIEFFIEDDRRSVQFKIGKENHRGNVVDLPCVIESNKTTDNTNFYKTADIGQIVVIEDPEKKGSLIHYDSEYQSFSGITPPTKNIKRRKFKKATEKKVNLFDFEICFQSHLSVILIIFRGKKWKMLNEKS